MHCPGHQKGQSPEAKGNRLADNTAREIAMKSTKTFQAFPLTNPEEAQASSLLPYSKENIDLLKEMGATHDPKKHH